MSKDGLQGWQSGVSGAVAGLASRSVISPFDVIKIRLQLQSVKVTAHDIIKGTNYKAKYRTVPQAMRLIVKEEGVLGLWKGNLAASYLYLIFGGCQFWTFNELQRLSRQNAGIFQYFPQPTHTFLSGGTIATIATYPFDLLRTRFAVQGTNKVYSGILDSISQIKQKEGISGFYRGLTPSVLSIIPQMGMVFEVHRFLRGHYHKIEIQDSILTPFISGSKEIVSGGLAGMLTKIAFMPLDVIRKRLQVQGPIRTEIVVSNVPRYSGVLATGWQITKHETIFALYKGLVPSLLKAGPSSAVTFFVVAEMRKVFI